MTSNDESAALARILGPVEPEIGCDACFDLIDEYVDLELSGADADVQVPGMRPHLDGCPACAEEHASLRALVTSADEGPGPG